MTELFWDDERVLIDDAVASIQRELATTDPGLSWRTGYVTPQPVFPFRAYASIALDDRDDDIDSIDFSIDCKLENGRLRITSDICYSDGQFIAEGPVAHEPEGIDRAAWVHERIEDALGFFRANLGRVRQALRAE
ncbi:hypothetical protein [Microlunatus sp. GCM10028923]|uniref:hypothetical protein n=1 Tax=Microlunatus sp. GCM10028923 TaxID=3273400 RepID=UPI00360C048D